MSSTKSKSTKKRTQPKRQAKKAVKYTGCGIKEGTGRCKKGERKGRKMCDLNSETNRCNYSKVWRETSRICALNKTGRCAKGADGKRRGCELGEKGWCKKVKKVVRKRKAAPASSKKQPASKKKKVVKKKADKKPASKKVVQEKKKSKQAPKNKAAKKPRKSPSESAKTHPVGTKKEGNDKNMLTLISFEEYQQLPKGKLTKDTYKEKSSTQTKVVNKRKKGTRVTKTKKNQTKKESPKKVESNFIPDVEYYIEDTRRRANRYKAVYKGTFVKTKTFRGDVYVYFDNVKQLVAPFGVIATPSGFRSKGHRFIEVK